MALLIGREVSDGFSCLESRLFPYDVEPAELLPISDCGKCRAFRRAGEVGIRTLQSA